VVQELQCPTHPGFEVVHPFVFGGINLDIGITGYGELARGEPVES
jgi:hypothetical protein